MGPPSAAEVLRECLYRGADDVALVTDIKFAGADTLATAYALCCAIRHIGAFDLIIAGRQAIDGDTAQIGPQVAGNLGIPQITYAEELRTLGDGKIRVRRAIEGGYEVVEAPLPLLMTVGGPANEPRPPCVKRLMRYKKARTASQINKAAKEAGNPDAAKAEIERLKAKGLLIPEWNVETIAAEAAKCGLSGSPTRVYKVDSVVLTSTAHKRIEPTREGIRALVHELIADHALD
jgi:electron transfer flavoprotein beta subunit